MLSTGVEKPIDLFFWRGGVFVRFICIRGQNRPLLRFWEVRK